MCDDQRAATVAACVLALIVVLMGCESQNSIFGSGADLGAAGSLLQVDANKHLTADCEYHEDNTVMKYNRDGSFEESYFSGSTTQAAAMTGGYRGSYTYDPQTLQLILTVAVVYSNGSWSVYAATVTHTIVKQYYFAEHRSGYVYKKVGTDWAYTYISTYADTARPGDNVADTTTYSYRLSPGTGGFQYTITGVKQPTSGQPYVYYSKKMLGDAEFFPAGATLEKGKTVTVRANVTTNEYQDYNPATGSLIPVQNGTLGYYTVSFVCSGEFLIHYPDAASRTLSQAGFGSD